MRLSVRIGLAILGLVSFVTIVQGATLALVFLDQMVVVRERLANEGLALARLAVIGDAVDDGSLRRELGPLDHLRVGLYDTDGARVAASHDDPAVRARLDDDLMARARSRRGGALYVTPLRPGAPTDFVIAVEGARGTRYLTFYEDSALRQFPSTRGRILLFASLVAVALALAITWLIARRVRLAIQTTERTVRRMAAGDLSARLEDLGDDELGQLGRDFNAMAAQLARHVARLEAEEASRKALFAAFTHEINTPLTAVLGYLESLRMPEVDADAETRRRYVSVAFDQAQKLDALADDLTTLSKLDYDGIALEREPIDVRRVVQSEMDALAPRASQRAVMLRIEGDEAVADVDRARLAQVVRNLIDNAVRHGAAGSEVLVRIGLVGADVVIDVVDRGEGIAPEHLERLGTPLYRVDASRARDGAGGRGLGLAIARGLARAHGGTLVIASTPNVGTTVSVRIPTKPSARD